MSNKKNKKDKNNVLLVIGVLLVIVVIGVGYAALETTLNINGTANIGTNTWNIYFDNVQVSDGSVDTDYDPQTSGTTTISVSYNVTLQKPGDFYEFTIDVVNGGTIDAALQSQTLAGAESYDFINYTVTKADGSAVPSDLVLTGGDGSTPGQSVKLKVRVEYDKNAVSNSNVSLNISPLALTYQMKFVQD